MTIRRHGTLTPAAQLQQGLWGTDPQGWAELAEPHNQPLFEALLDATATRSGTRLLDIGCGSGLLMSLAAGRGAGVAWTCHPACSRSRRPGYPGPTCGSRTCSSCRLPTPPSTPSPR